MHLKSLTISLIASLFMLAGCGPGRPRDIEGVNSLAAHADQLTINYNLLKQSDDYLRMVVTMVNDSDKPLHFAPITGQTERRGFFLSLPTGAVATRVGSSESDVVVPAHGSSAFDFLWSIYPQQPKRDWTWTCSVVGLMRGDQAIPDVTLAIPIFKVYEVKNNKTGKNSE